MLWRGRWTVRLRIASGLVLFTYVFLHFINIGLGLISPAAMAEFQAARQIFSRSLPGTIILYAALLTHGGLAFYTLAMRRTLRMPLWAAIQTGLGIVIPLLLAAHLTHTRLAHEFFGVNDQMGYIMVALWTSWDGWLQALLLLLVWTHGCIGMHFWLRLTRWWGGALPYMIGLAVLVPAFALAGFMTEGRRMRALITDPDARAEIFAFYNIPDQAALLRLGQIENGLFWFAVAMLVLSASVYLARKLISSRRSVRIRYVDGPDVTSPRGLTLLEMSRANGVPHTSLCGGRGRCTTCRVVIEEGAEHLHAPSEAELKSLRAVNAAPGSRLACQIRPTHPSTVFRVFRPDGRRGRAHASQGQEKQLAILFLDMRSFTARTTGQLPYDVVFLLNRFFDAIVPSITRAGGTVDKYLGDGLLAVFDAPDAASSARAGLSAAQGISEALADFNARLEAEGAPEVRIGMGLHLGELVLGEIGAAGNAPRTIIGDAVNAASRLEGQTKEMGVELLVSEAVLNAAKKHAEPDHMVTLDLRGVAEPVTALAVKSGCDLPGLLVPDTGSVPAPGFPETGPSAGPRTG